MRIDNFTFFGLASLLATAAPVGGEVKQDIVRREWAPSSSYSWSASASVAAYSTGVYWSNMSSDPVQQSNSSATPVSCFSYPTGVYWSNSSSAPVQQSNSSATPVPCFSYSTGVYWSNSSSAPVQQSNSSAAPV